MEPMEEAVDREIVSNDNIQKFIMPNLNFRAKVYHQLVNPNDPDIGQPPAIQHMSNAEIEAHPSVLNHPCFNQGVELHVKLVTEASVSVAGHKNWMVYSGNVTVAGN